VIKKELYKKFEPVLLIWNFIQYITQTPEIMIESK
jgi:hypothetical protein